MARRYFLSNGIASDLVDTFGRGTIAGSRFAVRRVVAPLSFYYPGALAFTLREAAGPASFAATVPAGNYTSASFATAVGVALTATASPDVYTAAVNADTGVMTITNTAVNAFNLWLLGNDEVARNLGFPATNPAPAAAVVAGTQPIHIAPNYLFIDSPELSALAGTAGTDPNSPGVGHLAAIPTANAPRFGSAVLEGDDGFDRYALGGKREFDRLRFYLSDDRGRRLALNGGLMMVELWAWD